MLAWGHVWFLESEFRRFLVTQHWFLQKVNIYLIFKNIFIWWEHFFFKTFLSIAWIWFFLFFFCFSTNFVLFCVENFILNLFLFMLLFLLTLILLSGDCYLVWVWCWPWIWCFLPFLVLASSSHFLLSSFVFSWCWKIPPRVVSHFAVGYCLLLAESVMFPSSSLQPLKVTFEFIFSWLRKLLACFVSPKEITDFFLILFLFFYERHA